MADNTAIEWTDATWNPIRARHRATGKVGWFCSHATPGCEHCYAEGINHRLGTGVAFKAQNVGLVEVFADAAALTIPLRWKRPRKIFVGSMTDLFGDFVTDAMIDQVFAVMALSPHHTFQVLTKRAERMREMVRAVRRPGLPERVAGAIARLRVAGIISHVQADAAYCQPTTQLPNVWLGVSAEDQTRADERIPLLLDTPAAKRFVSVEPLLGPITLSRTGRNGLGLQGDTLRWPSMSGPSRSYGNRLDWVIVGGESGPHARPMHPDWARQIRDDCAAAGVPFLLKQWGVHAWVERVRGDPSTLTSYRVGKRAAGRLLDGVTHDGFPA